MPSLDIFDFGMSDYRKRSLELDFFGIQTISIPEAASLFCKCQFAEGQISIEEEFDEEEWIFNESLEKLLAIHIQKMSDRLCKAVFDKTLPAIIMERNFDETIIPSSTYIKIFELSDWLQERGVCLGELFHGTYMSYLEKLYMAAEEAIEREKFKLRSPEHRFSNAEDVTVASLNYKIYQLESELAKVGRIGEYHKPLNPKSKKSLLTIIYGMACAKYQFGKNPRNTVSLVVSDLERQGITITDDTVKKWLDAASEAMQES